MRADTSIATAGSVITIIAPSFFSTEPRVIIKQRQRTVQTRGRRRPDEQERGKYRGMVCRVTDSAVIRRPYYRRVYSVQKQQTRQFHGHSAARPVFTGQFCFRRNTNYEAVADSDVMNILMILINHTRILLVPLSGQC